MACRIIPVPKRYTLQFNFFPKLTRKLQKYNIYVEADFRKSQNEMCKTSSVGSKFNQQYCCITLVGRFSRRNFRDEVEVFQTKIKVTIGY